MEVCHCGRGAEGVCTRCGQLVCGLHGASRPAEDYSYIADARERAEATRSHAVICGTCLDVQPANQRAAERERERELEREREEKAADRRKARKTLGCGARRAARR